MNPKNKKPGCVGERNPGQQHNLGHHAARRNYTKPAFARRTLPSAQAFYASEVADFSERDNDWAWGCCPFHDDHNPSFCMNLRTGWYQCKASHCGETGRNIVSFVGARDGLSAADAVRFLEGWV